MNKCKFWDTCALASEIYAWCLCEDRSKQCSFWEQNEQEAKAKDGHVRLKRWYEPGADRDDYYDLTDYEVYFDSIKKQFKAKFCCPDCGKLAGVFCYPTDRMNALLHELFEGLYWIDCFEQEYADDNDYNLADDDSYEIMEGVVCSCTE